MLLCEVRWPSKVNGMLGNESIYYCKENLHKKSKWLKSIFSMKSCKIVNCHAMIKICDRLTQDVRKK